MTPGYSVIVPVYNAEKYLESCIESVLAQNTTAAFELILVNDGSRDGSAAICDRYAAQDGRIRVIHQRNQGVSVARNTGIAAAQGEYLLFLDSDDLWDENLLASVDRFMKSEPDMVEFGSVQFWENQAGTTVLPACIAKGETGAAHFANYNRIGEMPIVACWATAFRRRLVEEQQVWFPVGVTYAEDFYFYIHCLMAAKSIYTVALPLYRYRMNEQSATHNLNVKKLRDVLSMTAKIYRLFPCELLADYYCMRIWLLEKLNREDADQLMPLLEDNCDILTHVCGKKARLARGMYRVFGWHRGAKLLRYLADLRNFRKK